MQPVEKVGEAAKERHGDPQAGVGGQASWASYGGKVQVKRVDEEGEEAGNEEDVVPVRDDVAVRVEDLVAP